MALGWHAGLYCGQVGLFCARLGLFSLICWAPLQTRKALLRTYTNCAGELEKRMILLSSFPFFLGGDPGLFVCIWECDPNHNNGGRFAFFPFWKKKFSFFLENHVYSKLKRHAMPRTWMREVIYRNESCHKYQDGIGSVWRENTAIHNALVTCTTYMYVIWRTYIYLYVCIHIYTCRYTHKYIYTYISLIVRIYNIKCVQRECFIPQFICHTHVRDTSHTDGGYAYIYIPTTIHRWPPEASLESADIYIFTCRIWRI